MSEGRCLQRRQEGRADGDAMLHQRSSTVLSFTVIRSARISAVSCRLG